MILHWQDIQHGGAIAIRYMARHKGYGVSKLALFAAAAPSLIKRPNFPYGLEEETVLQIIQGTYTDRPKMLQGFGDIFFYQHITEAILRLVLPIGITGSRVGNCGHCKYLDK